MNCSLGMRENLEFSISKDLRSLVLMSIVHRSPESIALPLCLRELLEAVTRGSLISKFVFNAQRQEKTSIFNRCSESPPLILLYMKLSFSESILSHKHCAHFSQDMDWTIWGNLASLPTIAWYFHINSKTQINWSQCWFLTSNSAHHWYVKNKSLKEFKWWSLEASWFFICFTS